MLSGAPKAVRAAKAAERYIRWSFIYILLQYLSPDKIMGCSISFYGILRSVLYSTFCSVESLNT